ncbi:MAG TPA: mechanosensitive ion channel [Saprospiraceae bacterium]|nr:mechanosensitive ion channel [Saprospiraceae bacterium]HNJ62370.1 mechanosensitive ion channel [Saprospiraceae bacterium]
MEKYIDNLLIKAVEFAPKLVMALITLFVGFWLINRLTRLMVAVMKKRELDETVVPFLESIVTVILKALVLVSVAGMFGIETTSFVTILGAAGLAVGLALQGSLGHFASGILILLFKPYKVGDTIRVKEFEGVVEEIQVFNTLLRTNNNKKIIIPNGVITADPIINITGQGTLRVVADFVVAYEEDIDKVRKIILEVIRSNERIFNDPAPEVQYNTKGFGLAVYECTFWCHAEEQNQVYYFVQEHVRKSFDRNGIKTPEIGFEYGSTKGKTI